MIALKKCILSVLFVSSSLLPVAAFAESQSVLDEVKQSPVTEALYNVSGRVFSDYYSNLDNYNLIYRNVMSWYGSTTNGCVAFASTALRFLGVNIPQNGIWNGERISLLTKPFADYLEYKLGWIVVMDSSRLKPGDLVFTVDEPKAPGYPAHVFMHAGYADSARTLSLAVDNQGFTHPRALAGDVVKDYSAFAFALRSPVP